MDDSDDSGDESPSTPRASSMWSQTHGPMMHPNGMTMQRFPGQYIQPSFHRPSVSSNGTPEYGHPMHHEIPMMRRLSSQQQQLYVADGPGVQTMAPSYSQVPRHTSISYNDGGMTASLNSSPSTFSSGSVRSPGVDGGYTFQPAQAATHALHGTDHQPQTMGHYPPSSQPMMLMQNQHAHNQHPQSMANHGVYHQQMVTSGPVSSSYDNPNQVAMQDPAAMNFYLPIESGFKVEDHIMLPNQRINLDNALM